MTGLLIGYLAAHRSPLSADIGRLISEGVENNIDPRVFVAIAAAESGWFTAPNAVQADNPFGMLERVGNSYRLRRFSSVSAAIDVLGDTLTSQFARGNDTIAELYSGASGAYCVGNCANGQRNATSALSELGGNPNNLRLPSSVAGVQCDWRTRR